MQRLVKTIFHQVSVIVRCRCCCHDCKMMGKFVSTEQDILLVPDSSDLIDHCVSETNARRLGLREVNEIPKDSIYDKRSYLV